MRATGCAETGDRVGFRGLRSDAARRSTALLAVVGGLLAGCGEAGPADLADDATSDAVEHESDSGTQDQTDATDAPTGDRTGTSDSTSRDEATDDSTARDEADDDSTASRDESDAHAAMSFADFHARAQELVGQSVSVEGRVLFDLTCPPPDQPDQDCIAEAQLVDPSVHDLSETDEVVPLFEGDKTIACTAETANNLECRGLRDGETFVVDARVDERTGYGVVLDVRSSRSTG